MSINHSKSVLAVGVLAVLLSGSLSAQDLETMELFAPADLSVYGSGPQPRQGYFFVFDGLLWSISKPEKVPIGHPSTRLAYYNVTTPMFQTNDMDTGPLASEFTEGNRIEFGRVYGRHGWLFSSYRLNDQVQDFSNVDVDLVFLDLPDALGFGHLKGWVGDFWGYLDDAPYYDPLTYDILDLPITFDQLLVENRVETWGVELMYLYRAAQVRRGGFIEFFAGVRYLEFDETFQVNALGKERVNAEGDPVDGIANARYDFDTGPDADPTDTNWSKIGPGVVLADSNWNVEAENHIIGPQLGGRWFRKNGRWTLNAEGRFFAGLNMQNIRSHGVLGSELDAPQPWNWALEEEEIGDPPITFITGGGPYLYAPLLRSPYKFDHTVHLREWSPGAELRLELMFQLTDAVSLKAGWTGLWLGGIARGCAMPDYTLSDASVMGINRRNNDQVVFVNGLNVGLTVNR